MDIAEQKINDVIVFSLKGRIDSAGAATMDQVLQEAVANAQHKMVLNMAEVTYINSAGLRALADILTRNRSQNGDLRLVALNPKVERVFKIIGFDKFFALYPTIDEALAGF